MLQRKLTIAFLVLSLNLFGQFPGSWSVNPPSYNYSMTLTGYVLDSCVELTSSSNGIAAFVNGQCRGYAQTDVVNNGRNLGFLTIYSNVVSGETVQLRFYNNGTSTEKASLDGITFQSNGTVGSVQLPFELTTNHAPTNLAISNNVMQESTQIGGTICSLSAQDQDALQILTYNLSPGTLDNDDFLVSGTELKLNVELNHAIKDSFQIELTVNDGNGCSLIDTFWLVVDDEAFPPVCVGDTLSINEDASGLALVLNNDTDYDNDLDLASVIFLDQPLHGIATVDSVGIINYVPDDNYFGDDSLHYQVNDKTNTGVLMDSAWLIIHVLPVPDPPVALDDNGTTDEEVALIIAVLLNDTDIENNLDPTALEVLSGPYHGTTTIINGEIVYTPNLNYFGKDSLTYVICDLTAPSALCDTAILKLSVAQVADAPTDIQVDSLFVDEDNATFWNFGNITTTDVDSPDDEFTYALVPGTNDEDNSHFEIDGDQLILKTKTNFDIKKVYHFRLRATDKAGLSTEKAFDVGVRDVKGNTIPLPIATYISNNGDGKNDFLTIQDVDIYDYFQLTIFDQFGHKIYHVDREYDNKWDGTKNGEKLPTGAYYYWFRSETKEYKGNITIVN